MIIVVMILILIVIILCVLFYFLNRRVDGLGKRMGTVYANVDLLHKNQEELLAQNLRIFHDTKKKDKERK